MLSSHKQTYWDPEHLHVTLKKYEVSECYYFDMIGDQDIGKNFGIIAFSQESVFNLY